MRGVAEQFVSSKNMRKIEKNLITASCIFVYCKTMIYQEDCHQSTCVTYNSKNYRNESKITALPCNLIQFLSL